jgi:hypothetical protein
MVDVSSLDNARRRKRKPLWRYALTFVLAFICMGAVWAYFSDIEFGKGDGISWFPSSVSGFFGEPDDLSKQGVSAPSTHDFVGLDAQREIAHGLARRYVGSSLSADMDDLRILQSIVDQHAVDATQVFELQALGVALGDVMVAELGFKWIVLRDKYGRSRALQYKATENYVFPITMISRRVEGDLEFIVKELFDKAVTVAADADADIGRRSR